jgi:kynurenine formamidase
MIPAWRRKAPRPVLIELSHAIESGMTTHPGIPAPTISTCLSHEASAERYAPGTSFEIARIDMVANTGTYVDTPAHRYPGGQDLSEVPLERLVDLDGVVVDCRDRPVSGVEASAFRGVAVAGRAVLVLTGWDANWGTAAYLAGNPFLTEDAARWLVAEGAALIGSTRLTWTRSPTRGGPRTRCCWVRASPSSSTSRACQRCHARRSGTSRRRRASAGWRRFRSEPLVSCPENFVEPGNDDVLLSPDERLGRNEEAAVIVGQQVDPRRICPEVGEHRIAGRGRSVRQADPRPRRRLTGFTSFEVLDDHVVAPASPSDDPLDDGVVSLRQRGMVLP